MQARGFLPQKFYRWEQIGCLRRSSAHFKSGRRGDTDSSRRTAGELSDASLKEKLLACSLLRELHSRVIRAGLGASFTDLIGVASSACVASRVSVGTIVGRGHDQHGIAVDIDIG